MVEIGEGVTPSPPLPQSPNPRQKKILIIYKRKPEHNVVPQPVCAK